MSEEKLNMRDETLLIRTRLERVALCADIASHYVQDMRVMPASGVARVAWDAMDHIEQMEKALREKSFSEMAALGQASDAHDAQKAAEAERDNLFRKAALAEEWRDSDRQRALDAEAKLALAVTVLRSISETSSRPHIVQLAEDTIFKIEAKT